MMKQMSARKAIESGKQVYMARYGILGEWEAWKPVTAERAQHKSYVCCDEGFCPYRFAIEA